MNAHSLKILEFNFVLEALTRKTGTPYGRAEALVITPSTSPAVIAEQQAVTAEARRMLEAGIGLDFGNVQDIRPALGALAAEGAIIEPLELLQLGRHLEVARRIKSTISLRKEDYPLLDALASGFRAYKVLEDRITRSIEPDGRVADRASDTLYHLRRDQEALRVRIYDKLESIMNASSGSIQESVVTIREGRYVIPVKSDAKSQVKGIVHDTSSSGATVFVEPLVSVELNNKMRQVILAEKREVERILQEFSKEILDEIEPIQQNLELISQFDLIIAKARLASEWQCSQALRSQGNYLKVAAARHPALESPVPLDMELGDGKLTMVITGPNTGGKTVVLKTVGLLVLMNQSGLQVPAAEGSALPVFDEVFADIGDEQSISQSLSTFSSHMRQIGNIVREAGERSLVLLDEIGGRHRALRGIVAGHRHPVGPDRQGLPDPLHHPLRGAEELRPEPGGDDQRRHGIRPPGIEAHLPSDDGPARRQLRAGDSLAAGPAGEHRGRGPDQAGLQVHQTGGADLRHRGYQASDGTAGAGGGRRTGRRQENVTGIPVKDTGAEGRAQGA